MSSARLFSTIAGVALWLSVVASALVLVEAKHTARKLFAELQQLEAERDQLDIDWGRLQIEQSTWATHGRVERLAREKLDMRLAEPEESVIVQP